MDEITLDPAVHDTIERLRDAADELREALDRHMNETGLLLRRQRPTPELLEAAREQLRAAEASWEAAANAADELLRDRRRD